MYGKLFTQMYDSSLCEVWEALITFQQLIVLSDSQGVVDMTHEAIHRRTNIPLDIIQRGVTELEKEDSRSRSPEADGRRIERLDAHRDWGWRIVNYSYYRTLASAEEKREADRLRLQRKRAADRGVSPLVADGRGPSLDLADVAQGEGEEEGKRKRHGPPSGPGVGVDEAEWVLEQVKPIYPKREGHQRWPQALRHIRAALKAGLSTQELIAAVTRYATYCDTKQIAGGDKVLQAATFFGEAQGWRETWEVQEKAKPRHWPAPGDESGWKRLGREVGIEPTVGESLQAFQARVRDAVAKKGKA